MQKMRYGTAKICLTLAIFLIALLFLAAYSKAATLEELRTSVTAKNEEIKKLEEEAKKYRDEIAEKQQMGKTLKEELARVDRTIAQLKRDISLTERKIQKSELEIETLDLEIREKEIAIQRLRLGLANLMQSFVESEQQSLLEILLKNRFLSDFFQQIDYAALLKKKILGSLDTLRTLRNELQIKKAEAEDKKDELENLEDSLRTRRTLQENTKKDRSDLLRATQSQEKKYQEILRDREKKRNALEEEIREIEEKMRITIDPASLPPTGTGVLGWPLPDISLASCWSKGGDLKNCITQYFGYTSFAAVGGYSGKGHNGVDFRAVQGTPVFAASNGTVETVGDTDLACRRASYGKWILIRHGNNLSTLYAHLAGISVRSGQEVSRGGPIGLSGASGYATGPHLHFTVFASQAVRIEKIRSRTCGTIMTVPISPINGYLNPLDYL